MPGLPDAEQDAAAGAARCTPLVLAAGGGYAARLVTRGGEGWYPERWTLHGPEPYAVPLPGGQPEDAGSEVLPLADGRVLIARRAAELCHFALVHPSGPRTAEVPLGSVDCRALRLLPPSPDGRHAYALVPEEHTTALWLVCGGAYGPEPVARLAGRCTGGAWLDTAGRLLALDRTDAAGRTRAVTVDVQAGGEPSVLLQISEESNDRLLMADPDSGLLLVCSDAPGEDRVGWGVLGSRRPVRFPEALRPGGGVGLVPLAIQPGQVLMPEACGVALRMTEPGGRQWVGVWRPQQREVQHVPPPDGWLAGAARWTEGGELLLPYATAGTPCGLARLTVEVPRAESLRPAPPPSPAGESGSAAGTPVPGGAEHDGVCRPVPLQQAPLARLG